MSESSKQLQGESFDAYAARLKQKRLTSEAIERQFTESNQNNENVTKTSTKRPSPRRRFSKLGIIGTGVLALASVLGIGYIAKNGIPETSFGNTPTTSEAGTGIGEGEPLSGELVLDTSKETIASVLTESMGWIPDGRTPYITLTENGQNIRRYFFSGGPDNASYMLQSDGTIPLEKLLEDKDVKAKNFQEVFGPDVNVEYRKYYAGITSILQFDKSNPEHLLATYHGENRPTRDASNAFVATVGLAESFDGGQTWKDKEPLIQGTDVATPGYKDSNGKLRVSGAGQPSAIYNPADGYVHFAWIDWRADETKPDQIYGARAKANDNGTLGQLEYWANNGYSTNFDGNSLKPILPVPQDQPEMDYTALPSMSWSNTLNQFVMTGESDNGFWYSTSTDFVNWVEPKIMYNFSQKISIADPDNVLGPYNQPANNQPKIEAGAPHNVLQVGQLWESYPMLWDESQTSSDILGQNVVLLHSAGNNIVAHQPTFTNGQIIANK